MSAPNTPTDGIDVHISFAAAGKPYKNSHAPDVTLHAVLAEAKSFFGIADDGATRYYFLAGGAEASLDATLASVVTAAPGAAQVVNFKLRTETISGGR